MEWTPGHASVQGNETADRLAKEAAREAQEQTISTTTVVTKQDIKSASRLSELEKWQKQWENSERGRHYFYYHKKVKHRINKDFPNKHMASIITGLRSGFINLNYYKHLLQQIDSPNCECGETETVEHYLLHCEKYDNLREKLRTEIYFITGSLEIDLETLLSFGPDDVFKNNRDNIICMLAEFVDDTGRFNSPSSLA